MSQFAKAAVILLVVAAGRAQTSSEAPRPLGKLVDVGGYRVHLYCVGAGSPTVVITGAGFSFDWGLVQPEVAKFTRVCAYDHSGIAWSDPGPTDSCSLRVTEVHTALKNAGITGPYVVVGHSLGALVSRLYASKFDGEVAGMVIVDHAAGPSDMRISGGPPLVMKPDPNSGFEKLPERDYKLHLWASSQPGSSMVMRRNTQMLAECRDAVDAATQHRASPLGDKPFIAVSSAATQQLHAELLALSSNSKQVIAADSGHYVMVDRPDVVIGAIREVVEAARSHTKLKK